MNDEDKAQCRDVLKAMTAAKDGFYSAAARIGHHQYLEFTGVLAEYIVMCEAALDAGLDFRNNELSPRDYMAEYVEEKLGCIFGRQVRVHLAEKAPPDA